MFANILLNNPQTRTDKFEQNEHALVKVAKNKAVTILIIKEAHERSNHAYSLNWTVSELKKRFYQSYL